MVAAGGEATQAAEQLCMPVVLLPITAVALMAIAARHPMPACPPTEQRALPAATGTTAIAAGMGTIGEATATGETAGAGAALGAGAMRPGATAGDGVTHGGEEPILAGAAIPGGVGMETPGITAPRTMIRIPRRTPLRTILPMCM